MRFHANVQYVWTSALVITILLCGQNVDGQPACRNTSADVNNIQFNVSYEYNFTTYTMGFVSVDISWTVDNPDDILLDGFAVHFLDVVSKKDHENVYASVEPLRTCTSGPDHIFVTTSNQSVCDIGDSAPTCGPPDSCLCPQPECALFFPAPCKSVTSLMPNDKEYFVTVQPDVRRLSYPITLEFLLFMDHEFSITPYYREFANLSPDVTSIPSVDACSDEYRFLLDEIIKDRCGFLNWTDVAGAEEYLIVVNYFITDVAITQSNFTSIESEVEICDIHPCKVIDVLLFGLIDGILQQLPFDFQSELDLLTSTTPATTATENTTQPSPELVCPRISCSVYEDCLEVDGISHECVCEVGYERNVDGDCKDIDECATTPGICAYDEICLNNHGSFYCFSRCSFDAVWNGTDCTFPELCGEVRCTFFADCEVGNSSTPICVCYPGYTGDGVTCEAIDPCNSSPCHEEADCNPGTENNVTFTCTCRPGFAGDGNFCEDIDECATALGVCADDEICLNTIGAFDCVSRCSSDTVWNGTDCIIPELCGGVRCNTFYAYCDVGNSSTPICVCYPGYTGDGVTCDAVDPCKSSPCHEYADCNPGTENNITFTCKCKPGFDGDGNFCEDRNECATTCPPVPPLMCLNTIGSFECISICSSDTVWNGTDCIIPDIDECATALGVCADDEICLNTIEAFDCVSRCSSDTVWNGTGCIIPELCGGVRCNTFYAYCDVGNGSTPICVCIPGYTGDGVTCADIDECATNPVACADDEICVNLFDNSGAYYCFSRCSSDTVWNGTDCTFPELCGGIRCTLFANCEVGNSSTPICVCYPGYTGDGVTCEAIDPCNSSPCHEEADCNPGTENNVTFTCTCRPGFDGDGNFCEDIDECATIPGACADGEVCLNFIGGSFECISICSSDTVWNGTDCIIPDIDECATTPGICADDEVCFNTIGSFDCISICSSDTVWNGTDCIIPDIDECATILGVCADDEICLNTIGSFDCISRCSSDTVWNGTDCIISAINLCELEPCDGNAECTSTDRGIICTCNPGFTGDGQICEEYDICDPSPCNVYAECSSSNGTFSCSCNEGFVGDGRVCDPIHACVVEPCDVNAECTPIVGEYLCTCNPGFTGDGEICFAINPCESATCDINAYCTAVGEGYICTCNPGFTGGGQICNEMNCNSQTISGFQFSRISPGLTSYSEEKCEGSTVPRASISCIFGSVSPYFDLETLIRTNCSKTIKDVTTRPANTSEEVTESLDSLQVLTSNVEELQEEEVEEITKYFDDLTTTNLQYTKIDLDNVAEITSHLVDFYSISDQVETPEVITQKQNLVQSVTTISRKYDSSTSDGYVVLSDTINIEVQDVPNTGEPLTFTAQFYSDSETDETVSPIEIEIPAEAIQKADEILGSNGRQSSSVRVVSVGYRSSSLFPSDKETEWVIASSLGDETRSLDGLALTKPVKITNNVIKERPSVRRLDDFNTNITYFECVFWDFNTGTWSDEGCRLVNENPPTCECDHLTNFAVLVSKAQVPSNKAIGIVTYVGCGLSVICLVFTVAVIALERRLRRKNAMRVLMNICVCLGISMLFFIFGVASDTNTVGCQIITGFLQYFLLATWFWMAAYSHIIYRDVVKMWETRGTSYKILIAAIVCYGVPLVTVILNASIAIAHVDKNNPDYGRPLFESAYTARNFCWLRHNSLYFGFLLPVGILLLINLVIFCIVIPKITCCRKELQSTASKHTFKQHLVIALVMATTIGLSWIIGYLMLISDNAQYLEATSWIFAIVNSSQGIFIFFFTVVRTGELQKCFHKQIRSDKYRSSSTASTGVSPPSTMPRSVSKE